MAASHTPGPWDYVPGNKQHGPYVTSDYGSTICDCYVLSEPHSVWSAHKLREPVSFMAEMAEPNARLIAASPEMLEALIAVNRLISEAAMTGFNCHDGDWAERLFFSQQATSGAIRKALGRRPDPGLHPDTIVIGTAVARDA
ncbi:hypothetical protein [Methylorubrum suomiense]|uniref:Uncharacterized protein n=1 Tax=Methylorubrum suomiense TaxID=144191 RepID=A0ABQ4V0Q3_9HYPH|nr:hypothetical protein [Methylorubrum suomiense]GJE77214.1 hypothetical protein BGCPKDLD_3817 [Methylorubrum suomiense]